MAKKTKKLIYCNFCKREIHNKDLIRGDKCVWCDAEYYFNQKKKKI